MTQQGLSEDPISLVFIFPVAVQTAPLLQLVCLATQHNQSTPPAGKATASTCPSPRERPQALPAAPDRGNSILPQEPVCVKSSDALLRKQLRTLLL